MKSYNPTALMYGFLQEVGNSLASVVEIVLLEDATQTHITYVLQRLATLNEIF